MNKYSFSITLTEKSEEDAAKKMKGLVALASKLTAKEVSAMADIVTNDPIKTALAKKYMGL